MLAVLLEESNGTYAYGPFDVDDRDVAERLAAFLTAEVDPARVVPVERVGPAVRWKSALVELLNWHEYVVERLYRREFVKDSQ